MITPDRLLGIWPLFTNYQSTSIHVPSSYQYDINSQDKKTSPIRNSYAPKMFVSPTQKFTASPFILQMMKRQNIVQSGSEQSFCSSQQHLIGEVEDAGNSVKLKQLIPVLFSGWEVVQEMEIPHAQKTCDYLI